MGANFVKNMTNDGIEDPCDKGGEDEEKPDHGDHEEPTEPPNEEPATEEPATEEPPNEEPATEEPPNEEPPNEDPPNEDSPNEDPIIDGHNSHKNLLLQQQPNQKLAHKGKKKHPHHHDKGKDDGDKGEEDKKDEWHSKKVVEIKCAGERDWCLDYFRCRANRDFQIGVEFPEAREHFHKGHLPDAEYKKFLKECNHQAVESQGVCLYKKEKHYWYVEAPYLQLAEKYAKLDRSRIAMESVRQTNAFILSNLVKLFHFSSGRRNCRNCGHHCGNYPAGDQHSPLLLLLQWPQQQQSQKQSWL